MQNQPGQTPRKRARADASHDRQAARTSEDVFKGGQAESAGARPWLRNPWKPAAGRLFDSRPKQTEN